MNAPATTTLQRGSANRALPPTPAASLATVSDFSYNSFRFGLQHASGLGFILFTHGETKRPTEGPTGSHSKEAVAGGDSTEATQEVITSRGRQGECPALARRQRGTGAARRSAHGCRKHPAAGCRTIAAKAGGQCQEGACGAGSPPEMSDDKESKVVSSGKGRWDRNGLIPTPGGGTRNRNLPGCRICQGAAEGEARETSLTVSGRGLDGWFGGDLLRRAQPGSGRSNPSFTRRPDGRRVSFFAPANKVLRYNPHCAPPRNALIKKMVFLLA